MKNSLIILFCLITNILFSQDLKTEIIPTLKQELNGNTLLYCPAFEISWNNLKQYQFKGKNIKIKNAPDYLRDINESEININNFNIEQMLILSGIVTPSLADSFNIINDRKFPSNTINFSDYIGSIISYACINMELKYQTDFEIVDHPLWWNGKNIKSFGLLYDSDLNWKIGKQISIIDFKSNDDFIVEIELRNKEHELFFALVPSNENITGIYSQVESRIQNGKRDTLVDRDILQIPVIDLDVTRLYTGLINKKIKNKGCEEFVFRSVSQSIKLKIDETGVDFYSDAVVEEVFSIPKHTMIFDRPFMILIRDVESKEPIFIGWFENSEYMIKK
jgi:hypothetical protein